LYHLAAIFSSCVDVDVGKFNVDVIDISASQFLLSPLPYPY
jgi:hypothetical protein